MMDFPTIASAENPAVSATNSRLSWERGRSRRWAIRLAAMLPIFALVALFITTGLRGVNFGYHWDEQDYHLTPARRMVESGVLLPKNYTYPSFDKWLLLVPALPSGVQAAFDTAGQGKGVVQINGVEQSNAVKAAQVAMLALMDAGGYLLRGRCVFIVVSGLAVLWMYGAALALRHRPWEALVAASGLGLSWEFAYHSRWAVTDCILVQFTALTLFMLALYHRTGRARWIYAAGMAAGFATGTKYTGVLLLVAVVASSALSLPTKAYWTQIRRAVELCAVAFATYLVTTPGTLLEPIQFLTDTKFIANYYAHNPHAGHTVEPGFQHAWVALGYLVFVAFSPYQWIAAPLFAVTILGAVLWVKRDRRFAAILVSFPCLFVIMFCARYRLMIARNYLFLLPFLSLMLARGVADIALWLPRREWRWLFGAGLFGIFCLQATWLVRAGESIRHIDPDLYVRQALDYVRDHAGTQFRISNKLRESALSQHRILPTNVVSAPAGTEVVFFGIAEGPGSWYFQTNDPWLTKAVFGPREVNFDWYAGWMGHDRVVVMTVDRARATGVALAR